MRRGFLNPKQIMEMMEDGWTVVQLARYFKCSREAIYKIKNNYMAETGRRPEGLRKVGRPPKPRPDPVEAPVSELEELPEDIESSSSLEFLKAARDNGKVPWGQRIQAAIAVAKVETGIEDKHWEPPADPVLWGEALRDAIQAQSPEVKKKLLAGLKGTEK